MTTKYGIIDAIISLCTRWRKKKEERSEAVDVDGDDRQLAIRNVNEQQQQPCRSCATAAHASQNHAKMMEKM